MEIILEALENVKNYLKLISIADVADVLIIAFIIYKAMVLIHKTTAAQVLKGIAFIVVLLAISAFAGLNMLSFILTNTMQVGLIAVVIMFQPELRKMLETVGASRFPNLFDKFSSAPADRAAIERVVEQTVVACNTMSQQKVGALIIFERRNLLDETIATGTVVDAVVSVMLLKNIFFPLAALHDGAAIVRDGRLVSAGCMLPLTSNRNLSRDLGMRHRAGVGVSEVSDAVAVIVSEETGSVSVAVGGMLKRHLNTETLAALLKNELIPEPESGRQKGFRARFRRLTARFSKEGKR